MSNQVSRGTSFGQAKWESLSWQKRTSVAVLTEEADEEADKEADEEADKEADEEADKEAGEEAGEEADEEADRGRGGWSASC